MADEKIYLSKEKYKELSQELDFLTTTRRKEIADKLEYAKSLGDLSENAEYQEAREDQANTERRIMEIDNILKIAEVIKKRHSEQVEVGSIVIVQKEGEKNKTKYQIVGVEEADMTVGKISNVSPIGCALMGKKKGDKVSFKIPTGVMKYKIIEVK